MSRLESIESELKQLTAEELQAFRQWFANFDAEAWDQQFEADAQSGRLDKLAARALRQHEAGESTEL